VEISKRVSNITPSATLAVGEKARKLKQSGKKVISFAMGEPDFDTPEDIKQEAIRAMQEGLTKYTNATGIEELKEAIIQKFKRDNDLSYAADQVIASAGAKQVLYNALSVLCNRGDEVILITPCWVSYAEQVKLAEAKPVFAPAYREDGYVPRVKEIEEQITPRTRAIIINSPNNPTGAVYPWEVLVELAYLTNKHNLAVISDEVYEEMVFEDACHYSIAGVAQEVKENTIVVNAVSKTYSMTGWRIGYAVGPREVIDAMGKFQGHITGNPNSIAQKAAAHAITNNFDFKEWVPEYNRRRRYCLEKLNQITGIRCAEPRGTFYIFPDVSGLINKSSDSRAIKSSLDLAEYLLDEAQVAVVPGEAFKIKNHFRLSYATSMENIEQGIERIHQALKKLQ